MKPCKRNRIVERLLEIVNCREDSGVEDTREVGRLINSACDDVIVRQRSRFLRRMPMLLPDYIQNRLLHMQQDVLDAVHVLQLVHALPLHLHDLIVACSVVERVGFVREIVHDVGGIQKRNPVGVVPRNVQRIVLLGNAERSRHFRFVASVTRCNLAINNTRESLIHSKLFQFVAIDFDGKQ